MEVFPTKLPEVLVVKPRVFGDHRGFFVETWEERAFARAVPGVRFVQDNHSRSARGTLRGMHYQIQQAQGKLVRAARGRVFDVAVDMRRSSPRFGQWVGVELDDVDHTMLWVPPGFAHGFMALSESADFVYKVTDFYAPQFERTLRWDDPAVGIAWPLPDGSAPTLAARDAAAPGIAGVECYP